MCDQCICDTKTYGEAAIGWWLVQARKSGRLMKEGDWGLLQNNDPDIYWPEHLAPRKDPLYGMTDEQIEKMTPEQEQQFLDYQKYLDELEPYFKLPVEIGYSLIHAATQPNPRLPMLAGMQYDIKKDGYRFLAWLSHHMALAVERNPEANDDFMRQYYYESEEAKRAAEEAAK